MRRHHGHGQGRVETTISFFFFEGSIFFSSSVFALFAALFGDNNLVCFLVFVFFPLSSSEGLGLWGRRRLVDDSTIVRRHGNPESSFFEEQIREKSEK